MLLENETEAPVDVDFSTSSESSSSTQGAQLDVIQRLERTEAALQQIYLLSRLDRLELALQQPSTATLTAPAPVAEGATGKNGYKVVAVTDGGGLQGLGPE